MIANSTPLAKIVEKSSAMIGLPGEEWIPLNADHKTICKFESSADMNLKLVQNSIKKMMQTGIPSHGGKFLKARNHDSIMRFFHVNLQGVTTHIHRKLIHELACEACSR
jgi:hypothetical protein